MEKVCSNCRFCKRAISSMPCRICEKWNKWKPKKETTEFTIEELEKVKAEMEADLSDYLTAPTDFAKGYDAGLKRYIGFIERQISKLKGENNG